MCHFNISCSSYYLRVCPKSISIQTAVGPVGCILLFLYREKPRVWCWSARDLSLSRSVFAPTKNLLRVFLKVGSPHFHGSTFSVSTVELGKKSLVFLAKNEVVAGMVLCGSEASHDVFCSLCNQPSSSSSKSYRCPFPHCCSQDCE